MYVLARLYLASGVELGKDEAVYWYWGQHLDASYALLPFATLKLAHALWPYQEWFLRLPSILLGGLSAVLLYRLCRNHGLGERRAQEVRLEVVTAGEMEEREVEEAEQIAEGRGATEFEELLRYAQTHRRLLSVATLHVHI